jgi:hypothetical protein
MEAITGDDSLEVLKSEKRLAWLLSREEEMSGVTPKAEKH